MDALQIMADRNVIAAVMFLAAILFGTPLAALAFLIQLWSMAFHRGKIFNGSLFGNATIMRFQFSRTFHLRYWQASAAGVEKFCQRRVFILKKLLRLFDQHKGWSKGQTDQFGDHITGDFLVYGRTLIAWKSEHDFCYQNSDFAKLLIYFGSWPAFAVAVVSLGALAAVFSNIEAVYMPECWLAATIVSFFFWRSLGLLNVHLATCRLEPLLKQVSPEAQALPDYAVRRENAELYSGLLGLITSTLILWEADYLVYLLGLGAPGLRP